MKAICSIEKPPSIKTPNNAVNSMIAIQNQSININLPNGIEKLNDREIEENLGKIVKSMDIKNDISVFLNQASSAELLALKVKRNFNQSLEIVIPSIEQ